MPNGSPIPVQPAAPGATPSLAGAAPNSPPFGSSPSVTPNRNQGLEAAAVQRLGVVIRMLTEILPMVGAPSEEGQSILTAIKSLSRHVRPGAVTPAAEANQLQRAQLQNIQNASLLQKLRQQQMAPQGAPGGVPGAPPRPPTPPMAA